MAVTRYTLQHAGSNDGRIHHKESTGSSPTKIGGYHTGAKNIGTAHDEIILEVPEKMAGEVAVILQETMIQAGKAYLGAVPIEVEVTIGETWAEKQG